MDKTLDAIKFPPAPTPKSLPIVDSVSASTLEAKWAELDGVRTQLEFQLNGVVNQIHLVKQLLQPDPPSEPDNTI